MLASRTRRVGSPPATGTDQTSQLVSAPSRPLGMWKMIVCQSGLKLGAMNHHPCDAGSRFVICVVSPELTSTTTRFPNSNVAPSRRWYTTVEPSGDHLAPNPSTPCGVSGRTPVPSAFATKTGFGEPQHQL